MIKLKYNEFQEFSADKNEKTLNILLIWECWLAKQTMIRGERHQSFFLGGGNQM